MMMLVTTNSFYGFHSDIVQYKSDILLAVEVGTLLPNEMMFAVLYGAFVSRRRLPAVSLFE